MAQFPVRQLLVWTFPSAVALISYLWYKRKRTGARSDSGGSKSIEEEVESVTNKSVVISRQGPLPEEPRLLPENAKASTPLATPAKKFNRSLSGVESAPIDIVYPPELRSKSISAVISDEDLDLEIEKVKSLSIRNRYISPNSSALNAATVSNTPKARFTPEEKVPALGKLEASAAKESNAEPSDSDTMKSEQSICCKIVQSPVASKSPAKISKAAEKMNEELIKIAKKDAEIVENEIAEVNEGSEVKGHEGLPTYESEKEENLKQIDDEDQETHRKNSVRDSANHSPSDAMMISPSSSCMSDNHSEGSSDSGKGGSEVTTPPSSRTPQLNVDSNPILSYSFNVPQGLVGKLIGKNGCFVQSIKAKCNARVFVKTFSDNENSKVCCVEGTQADVEKALKMIRDRFPKKRHPDMTLEEVKPAVPMYCATPRHFYLKLIAGINNDTVVSCMVTPNHLFMQQPTHPSFPGLAPLTDCMNVCYGAEDTPLLPTPIKENTICCVYSVDSWCRALVLSYDEETNLSYIQYLDIGGYAYVDSSQLRQIRQDFMLLPFQAAECLLANVKSKNEDDTWPQEAYDLVADYTKGSLLYTQIVGHNVYGIPLVLCYVMNGSTHPICLNDKLVEAGLADWLRYEEVEDNVDETQHQIDEAAVAATATM